MTTLNAEFAAAREAGEEHEHELVGAYLHAIRKAGRVAASRFEERALTASANWVPPHISDVMEFAVSADRIRASQRRILTAIGGRIAEIPGVSFDALMPPTDRQLQKLGLRALALASDIRQPVGDAVARAWAEGRSIPDAAALIRQVVNALAPARAVMLARTDLISLSNGANQAAVGILNDAAAEAGEDPAVQSKTWLATFDARTRPSHADADGQTVPFDQPYDVGGEDLMYPGDPDGSDEEVINCRCTELYSDEAATSASTSELPSAASVAAAHPVDSMAMDLHIDKEKLGALVLAQYAPQDLLIPERPVEATPEPSHAAAYEAYIEHLSRANEGFLAVLREHLSRPVEPPVVNVHVPETVVNLPETVVHVAAPPAPTFAPEIVVQPAPVELAPAQAPVVNVSVPVPEVHVDVNVPPRTKDIDIERDGNGNIVGYRIEEA